MARSKKFPRRAKIIVSILVALTAVFYTAGGIVFANMIHADALMPQPPTPDNGVYVTLIDEDSVTLTSEEQREDTTRPGVAGLAWEGGYGLIGEITAVDGLDVTREFTLVSGALPSPCSAELSACDEVDIESVTFETDPSDVGLAFREVTYSSALGPMGAWRIDSGDGSTWAIHAHGWRSSRRDAVRMLPTYHAAGITSLVIDYRNDVEAPPDPGGLYRFGRTEWEDVEGAVRYALDQGAENILLHGYSTGAALHLAFLENSDLAGEVTAAVYDSPNIDMAETVRHAAAKRHLPGTPMPLPASLTAVAMFIADVRWEVGWSEIDYVDRAADIVTVPTLVFHGVEDDRVPIDVARRFRDRAPNWVQLVEVESAGHVTSWNVDPESYERVLGEFLEQQTTP